MAAKRLKPIPAPALQAVTTNEYTPTPKESAIAQNLLDRRKASAPTVKFNIRKTAETVEIRQDHSSPQVATALLMHALGTTNGHFSEALLSQLANVAAHGQTVKADDLNGVFAMVQGIGPKDETEAMLAAQMVAIHNATMTAAQRLNHVGNIPQQDSASTMLNKLARTFATQLEALKKYRSTGEQSIRVQHVTVNDGGQAIVGTVQTGGGGTSRTGGQPYEPCAIDECRPALLSHVKTIAAALPGPGGQGLDRLPLPRRPRRGAEGEG